MEPIISGMISMSPEIIHKFGKIGCFKAQLSY